MKMNPLLAYLKAIGKTQKEAAAELDVSEQQLSDVVRGRSYFGRRKLFEIEAWSGGRVGVREMLAWERPAEAGDDGKAA